MPQTSYKRCFGRVHGCIRHHASSDMAWSIVGGVEWADRLEVKVINSYHFVDSLQQIWNWNLPTWMQLAVAWQRVLWSMDLTAYGSMVSFHTSFRSRNIQMSINLHVGRHVCEAIPPQLDAVPQHVSQNFSITPRQDRYSIFVYKMKFALSQKAQLILADHLHALLHAICLDLYSYSISTDLR